MLLLVLETALLLNLTPVAVVLAASGSCLLCKKLGSAFTAAGLDLALALSAHGTCSLSGRVLRNEEWRRGFEKVTYTERCLFVSLWDVTCRSYRYDFCIQSADS